MNSKTSREVVFITGASSGIGKVTAAYLAERGYEVYGTSRNPKEQPDGFELVALDLHDRASILNAIQQVLDKAGRIDVLINNAGMGITGPIEETPVEKMRQVFETNFFGAIEMMQAVLPSMREQGGGLIINVTSIAGYMGLPYRGVYSATKGALELVSETVRMETRAFGIRVCSIAPGDFATNIASGRYHAPVIKGSAYEEVYQRNLDLMNTHVDDGGDPIEMARKIHEVILDSNPKVRYKVGAFMQKFSVLLKCVLPGKVYEKLLMRHYDL